MISFVRFSWNNLKLIDNSICRTFYIKGVIDVYKSLCQANDGKFPAFHSISGSDPKMMGSNCTSQLEGSINLDKSIESMSSLKEPDEITKSIHYHDLLLYIYTSGTTGMLNYSKKKMND